jgi:gliding motility associated protien GldN
MKKIFLTLGLLSVFGVAGFAQKDNKNVNKYLDYNYEKKDVKERKAIPYASLREADVIYAKRVERVIDSREKKNQVMVWPKSSLNRIIYNLVATGEDKSTGKLKAYGTDSLDKPYTIAEIKKIGGSCETVSIQNPNNPNDPYDTKDSTVCTPFDIIQIKRWKIFEEWIFDKQRSMFFPRIIALAPLYTPNLNGVPLPEQAMFYVNYQDLRPILVNEEVFTRGNDAMRLTYYDFFEQRLFSSYITKESNDKDFAIRDFPEFKDAPMDALYESERIKSDMFNWEHDLWEY